MRVRVRVRARPGEHACECKQEQWGWKGKAYLGGFPSDVHSVERYHDLEVKRGDRDTMKPVNTQKREIEI